MTNNTEIDNLIKKSAHDVLMLARSMLIVKLRFLDIALSRLELIPDDNATMATDGTGIVYGPKHVIRIFRQENERPARDYLHAVLHCIFSHMYIGNLVDRELWDLACDIAVESIINDLGLHVTGSMREAAQRSETERLRSEVKLLTAEKIYHCFLENGLPETEIIRLRELFTADDHSGWHRAGPAGNSSDTVNNAQKNDAGRDPDGEDDGDAPPLPVAGQEEDWKDIAEKIRDALETFFREQGDAPDSMMQNLRAVTREKYDYSSFLKKFSVLGETVGVNDEEFDYVYYTYGLRLYENMPLVEPLEYKEVKRIREFVIAVDTSGSTSGDLVQKFLQKTYNILKTSESYFSRINIHIIQCDADIQEHVKITSEEEFDRYISSMSIHGLGGTDFRPVFRFVDELVDSGEFTDLRGLIYFTDGFGFFPEHKPKYETAFVFLDNEYNNPDVPPWAIKVILQDEDI